MSAWAAANRKRKHRGDVEDDGMLCFTPPIMDDESLVGYLRRVSSANGDSSPAFLERLIGAGPRLSLTAFPAGAINVLAGLVGGDRRKLSSRRAKAGSGVVFMGQHVSRRMFNAKVPDFCPACLREGLYFRSAWHFTAVSTCPYHRCRLRSDCPTCGGKVRYDPFIMLRCVKGHDVREAAAGDLRATDLLPAQLLHEHLGHPVAWEPVTSKLNSTLRNFSLDEVFSAAELLYWFLSEDGVSKGIASFASMVERTVPYLLAWPDQLFNRLNRDADLTVPLASRPGWTKFYSRLDRFDRRGFPAMLKEAIDTHAKAGGYSLRSKGPSGWLGGNDDVVSSASLASSMGVGEAWLLQYMRERGVDFQLGRNGRGGWIDRAVADSIRDIKPSSIRDAMRRLGLSRQVVGDIIARGAFSDMPNAQIKVAESLPKFSVQDVERFAAKIITAKRDGLRSGEIVPYSGNMCVGTKRCGPNFHLVLMEVAAGRLAVADVQPGNFSEMKFYRDELVNFLKTALGRPPRHSNSMRVAEAARSAGMKDVAIYQAIGLGLLKAKIEDGIWHLNQDDLDDFLGKYATVPRLSKIHQVSPTALARWISGKSGVDPAAISADCKRPYRFYRVEDLDRSGIAAKVAELGGVAGDPKALFN